MKKSLVIIFVVGIFLIGLGFVFGDSISNLLPLNGTTLYFSSTYAFNCSVNTTNNSLKEISLYSNYSSDESFQKIFTKYAGDLTNDTRDENMSVIYLEQNYSINPTILEVDSGNVCTFVDGSQLPCNLFVTTTWLGSNTQYWRSTNTNEDHWINFNLDEIFYVEGFDLSQHVTLYARNLKVESSLDNSTWQTLFEVNNASDSEVYFLGTPVKAKYIKATFGNSSNDANIFVNYLNITGRRYNYSGISNISFDYPFSYKATDNQNYSWYCSYENNLDEITNSTSSYFNFSYHTANLTANSDKDSYLDNESVIINCSVTSEENLSSILIYKNNSGSYELVNSYFGNSLSGSSTDALLNLSATYPNQSLAEIIYVETTDSVSSSTCLDEEYQDHQCPSATLVNYDWNALNSRFWSAIDPGANNRNVITYDLKGDYSLYNITVLGHSGVVDFGITKMNLSVSTDRETWTQVYSNTSIVSATTNIFLNGTRARYVNLTVWKENLSQYVFVKNIQFYGQKYVINNSYGDYSLTASLDLDKNGTYDAFKCVAETIYGEKQTNETLIISVQTIPEVVSLTSYPNTTITSGNTLNLYCNITDDETAYSKSSLNSQVQYRVAGTNAWQNAQSKGFQLPYVIETIGDSITAHNKYQPPLDYFLGSNTTLYNFGGPGDTCDVIYTRYDANITNGTTVIIWCGINDVKVGEERNVKSDMIDIQTIAESKNNTPIWLNIGTAGNYTSNYTQSQAIFNQIVAANNWMENNFSQNYDLTLVDVYHELWNGTDAYCSKDPSYCNADELHINSLGGYVVAKKIWEVAFNYTKFNQFNYYYDIPLGTSSYYLDVRCRGGNGVVNSSWYTSEDFIYVSNGSMQGSNSNTLIETTSSGSGGTFKPSKSSLENGFSANVIAGQKVKVTYSDGDKTSDVEIKSVSSEKVVVTINGNDYEISPSASGKIDLDNDGVYDLEITSNKVYSNGVANLGFVLISEEVPKEEEKGNVGKVVENISNVVKNISWWIYLIIGVVIILIIVGIVLNKKVKGKDKRK